jgi:hypothetical protein
MIPRQDQVITLQVTVAEYEHIQYCIDYVNRNRERALKAYYDKKEKLGVKTRPSRPVLNLPGYIMSSPVQSQPKLVPQTFSPIQSQTKLVPQISSPIQSQPELVPQTFSPIQSQPELVSSPIGPQSKPISQIIIPDNSSSVPPIYLKNMPIQLSVRSPVRVPIQQPIHPPIQLPIQKHVQSPVRVPIQKPTLTLNQNQIR